uniref:Uncharacterized protein n=1 Tax=Plectus sambesii TaxID=2011161 RepID=A0A914WXD3_9BILA
MRLKRLKETPTRKRRQLEQHQSRDQQRVLNLTPKSAEDRRRQQARNKQRRLSERSPTSAERDRQHWATLRRQRLQQYTSKQRQRAVNRKWFSNWRRKLTPQDRIARLRRRRLKYAEKQRAQKSFGAEGSDHPRRAALQVHSNRCQTTVAKVDSSGRRTNTEYWRSKYRLLRKKRVFGLTENYLAQLNLKRWQKTKARKRMAERKMAKLYSTADEMRRIVQSDLHVMLQRFYKNNVLPASESVIDVENEVDWARKLAVLYGGQLQFHTRTHELFGIDFGQFIFHPIAEIVADIKAELKERDAVDEPDTQDGDTTDDILGSLIAKLGEGFFFDQVVDLINDEQNGAAAADQEASEQQATIGATGEPAIIGVSVANPEADRDADKAETWARRCSADCIIPAQWATRLHAGFLRIDPGGTAEDICRAMDEFERCARCSSEKRCDVGLLDKCTNTLNLLCTTIVHFQHLRTVLRQYYKLRQSFVWLRSVDKAVEDGDVVVLTELINKPNLHKNLRSRIAESVEREEKSLHSEGAILRNDHYRSMIDDFEEAIRNFRAYPCGLPPFASKKGGREMQKQL